MPKSHRTPPTTAAPDPLAALHERRRRRVLLLGSGFAGFSGALWGVVFALRGQWFTVGFDALALALAATTVVWVRQGRLRAASYLLVAVAWGLLVYSAALLDLPTPQVPRSIHQLLLGLAVVACLLMRDEPFWLRHGVPLVCLLSYGVFAATDLGWATTLALPDSLRAPGGWVNHALALVLGYVALQAMQADVVERNAQQSELRDALLRGEMRLHYQPLLAEGGRVVGAEALVRWQHPQRGLVPPGEFIPLAEKTGLVLPLGDWVLRTACAQLAQWGRRPTTASLMLAVNVSASQFAQADFVARVLEAVALAGADASRLKLELTESMLAHDLRDVQAKMMALKAHRIGFSLDDFGTGFGSLTYLQRLPFEQLKIDRSFVQGLVDSHSDLAIARSVLELGRSLGMEVIAEGVESPPQHRLLVDMGCRCFQGYLFSRPLPLADFEAFVAGAAWPRVRTGAPAAHSAAPAPAPAPAAQAGALAGMA